MKIHPLSLPLLLAFFLLTACHTSRHTSSGSPALPTDTAQVALETSHAERIARETQRNGCLTAKIKFDVQGAGKQLSVNGTLRMKHNDVVQISLRALGFEVGRLEFTPSDVLLVDRFNARYVRASYDEVAFLRNAGLDFYALQALFWNELFVPGERSVKGHLEQFQATTSGSHTQLRLEGPSQLTYHFLTQTSTARIVRVKVQPKNKTGNEAFEWKYEKFTGFAGKSFPTLMTCTLQDHKKKAGFTLQLGSMNANSDWETRTQVSGKYQRMDAHALFRQLLGFS